MAAEQLDKEGISCRVLHMHTIKPLDAEKLCQYASSSCLLVTVEEHTLMGGLGSAVVECLADNNLYNIPVKRLGIPDVFAAHYGSQDDLMQTYGLQPLQIAETIRRALEGEGYDNRRVVA
jgi:transketolase